MTIKTADADKPQAKLSAKDEVRALLDRLPDDVTLEDIQYHLDVVVKVLEAEAEHRARHSSRGGLQRGSRKMARTVVWSSAANADLDEIEAISLRGPPRVPIA